MMIEEENKYFEEIVIFKCKLCGFNIFGRTQESCLNEEEHLKLRHPEEYKTFLKIRKERIDDNKI